MSKWITQDGLRLYVGGKLWRWWKGVSKRLRGKGLVQLPSLVQHPSPNHSSRQGKKISLVVLHDTEGTYSSAVGWLTNSRAQASAHVVLREDGLEATQLVRWSEKAWACMSFNPQSLNLEMAGTKAKGFSNAQLDAAAAIVAYWCKSFRIPVAYSDGSEPGITFHQDLGVAGGGHTDPGWNAKQKAAFIARVRKARKRGLSPTHWGK